MFVIVVYDISEKRVAKILKKCRSYLYWVQNSVFEGEISQAKLKILKEELKKIMKPKEDSVIIYSFKSTKYSSIEVLGLKKGGEDNIL